MICLVVAEIGARIHLDPLITMIAAGVFLENVSKADATDLLHDFESGHLQLRALTPELDELPALVHGLAGRLSLAAFASAALIAAAILAPQAAGSTPMTVVATLLALASALGWAALLAWHALGRGQPLKLAPLLRLWRR